MGNVKIELNNEYVREVLLKGEPTQAICLELANNIALASGEASEVDIYVGRNRCNASVYSEYDDNTLLKAMGGMND